MNEAVLSLISAIGGGLVVWLVQQTYQNSKERRKSKRTDSGAVFRKLDKDALSVIKPGISVALANSILGDPFRVFNKDDNILEEEQVDTNSFLYMYKNANLKITSLDGITIDTVTLLAKKQKFYVEYFLSDLGFESNALNEATISQKNIEYTEHRVIATRHEHVFVFHYSIPNPFYIDLTIYSNCTKDWNTYTESKNIDIAIGENIFGLCLSGYMSNRAFYIYEYEANI